MTALDIISITDEKHCFWRLNNISNHLKSNIHSICWLQAYCWVIVPLTSFQNDSSRPVADCFCFTSSARSAIIQLRWWKATNFSADDSTQCIQRVMLLFRPAVTGPKLLLFFLPWLKPTICHGVSYVSLSVRLYKLFSSNKSAEIILLRLEKWMVWSMTYVSVRTTGPRYDVLFYYKCI